MKKAADKTLLEVRKKISDAQQSLKLLTQLRKLRNLRKDQAERKGYSTYSVPIHFFFFSFLFCCVKSSKAFVSLRLCLEDTFTNCMDHFVLHTCNAIIHVNWLRFELLMIY